MSLGANAALPLAKREKAMDAMLAIDSVRTEDVDGRMRIAEMNISKSCINPYKGSEVPQADALGLDPERVYYLYRHPEELAKAAASSNGVQILRKHIPVNAEDHQPWDVVGSTGTDGKFEPPYLKNSGSIWVADDIAGIKSGKKKQVSLGYHYRPDMTPGSVDGVPYDGVMRDIIVNHLALVEDGRAGPDVVVADEAPDAEQWRLIEDALLARDADFNESDHPRAPNGKFGTGSGGSTSSSSDIADHLEKNNPGLKLDLSGRGDTVTLSRIVVPKEARSSGTGSSVMKSIIGWADANGKTIALSPSSDFGGNKSRLVDFYKRFGFVENKGKNKDFSISETMIRPPIKTAKDESPDAAQWRMIEEAIAAL